MLPLPVVNSAVVQAVSGTAAAFGSMTAGNYYSFVSSTACWIQQGSAPTATAGSGSMYLPANVIVYLRGDSGAKVSVIQDSGAGKATLTPIMYF